VYKHILLPTDGSELAVHAVKAGIALAKTINAKVTAVYANPGIGPQFFQMDAPVPESVIEAELGRLKHLEQRYLARVHALAQKAGVPCDTIGVTHPVAYEAIIETAKKRRCDLIVMASHGHTGLKAIVLGSVATKVLTHSKVPVLIWRR